MAISIKNQLSTLLKMDFKTVKRLLSQKHEGYLYDSGWFESFDSSASVDKNGSPVPWVTYPFIDFISERLNRKMDIFEFGSGSSTFFYSRRVNSVTTVEHNREWFDMVSGRKEDNVEVIFCRLDEDGKYCRSAVNTGRKFNLIIVDAEDRVNCIFNSLNSLTEDGVIVLDDSERGEYAPGIEFLAKNSFRRLDFWGIAPGILFKKCTTIFYKDKNCLGI